MISCNICKQEFSRQDSLSWHLKRKNTCSAPYEPETVKRTDVEQQQYVGAGEVHTKTLNPALMDSIVDEEHPPKKKKKTLSIDELFPLTDDLTPKIDVDDDITDTDTDDDDIDDHHPLLNKMLI